MIKKINLLWLLIFAVSASSFANLPTTTQKKQKVEVIYAEHKQTNKITVYKIDPDTGDLTRIDKGNTFTENAPADIAIFQDKAVYATSDVSSNITIFKILPDGNLKRGPNIPSGLAPWSTKLSASGEYAYAANYLESTISMYRVNQDNGKLAPLEPESKVGVSKYGVSGLGTNPLDPRHMYVTNFLSNYISLLSVDPETGILHDNKESFPAEFKPRAFAFDNDNHAYVLNFQSASISQYNVDPVSGSLTPMPNPSVRTGMEPMAITLDKSKKYLYIASKSENKIYMYKKQLDGSLEPQNPTIVNTGSYGPRSLGIDEHHHLYVTNMLTDVITKFDIESDGFLTSRKLFHTEFDPEVIGITTLELPLLNK